MAISLIAINNKNQNLYILLLLYISTLGKSYYSADPVLKYCLDNTSQFHPVQMELFEATAKHKGVILIFFKWMSATSIKGVYTKILLTKMM